MEGIPAQLYISASSDDITKVSSVDFEIGVDIDLLPLNGTLMNLLTQLSTIGYPTGDGFNKDLLPFLPRPDFGCVSKSAISYLQGGGSDGNYPLSGFLGAIAEGCSSNSLRLSGGYNSTSEELGMWRKVSFYLRMEIDFSLTPRIFFHIHPGINVRVDLAASRTVEAALKSLEKLLGGQLPLDISFFNNLTEAVELRGSVMIDLSFGARISRSAITNSPTSHPTTASPTLTPTSARPTSPPATGNPTTRTPTSPPTTTKPTTARPTLNQTAASTTPPSFEVFLLVNKFIATANVKASSLNMNFPLSLPGEGSLSQLVPLSLSLTNGSFNMGVHVNLDKPRNISDLFEVTAFEYGGSLDALFPVELAAGSLELGVTLKMSDSDIFNSPPPIIEYELDICPIVNELKNAVTNMTGEIMDIISTAMNISADIAPGVSIDFDQVTEPLMDYINTTLSNFSNSLVAELSSCGTHGRFLQGGGTNSTNSSLANTIRVAIENLNGRLNSAGITIDANIKPYFDSKEFAVGVDTNVSVTFEQVRNFL